MDFIRPRSTQLGLLGKMPQNDLPLVPPVPVQPKQPALSPPPMLGAGLLAKLWNFLTRILPAPTQPNDFFICYDDHATNES
jgi:hypothetical protein